MKGYKKFFYYSYIINQRQFITRKVSSYKIIGRLEELLIHTLIRSET